RHWISSATCPSRTSLTVTTCAPMTASSIHGYGREDATTASGNTRHVTRLGGPRRSLTGTAAVLRDLIMWRVVGGIGRRVAGLGSGLGLLAGQSRRRSGAAGLTFASRSVWPA